MSPTKPSKAPMHEIELVAEVSAVIPTGSYENTKPLYRIVERMEVPREWARSALDIFIASRTDELRGLIYRKLDEDVERLRVEGIKKQREDLRFYDRNGKLYPSVTSIISAIEPIVFDPMKLKQYASRGSLVHAQVEHWFKTGTRDAEGFWIPGTWEENLLAVPGTKLDYLCVTQGDLHLKWTDCNFRGFWEKYGSDFRIKEVEMEVFNDEERYAGRCDFLAYHKGKEDKEPVLCVPDIKTASAYDKEKVEKYMRQNAAYAKAVGAKRLVIIPLNPSNKGGFGAPIIEDDVEKYYQLFLQDRKAFKELYNI